MSLSVACAWAFVRSIVVVIVGLPVCVGLEKRLRHLVAWQRGLAWAGLLLPLLAPHLVTGYGYAHFSLSLVHHPAWNELLYGVLLLIASVPAGVVLLHFIPPPPVSPAALHCAHLLSSPPGSSKPPRRIPWPARFGIWARGPVRNLIPAGGLMFLVTFQEFEMASMMMIPTWTVWLFDAQTGGLLVSKSLQYASLPLLVEFVVLAPAMLVFWPSRVLRPAFREAPGRAGRGHGAWLWGWLAVSTSLFVFVPWSLVLGGSSAGYATLLGNRTLPGDVVRGLAMAGVAGGLACAMAGWLQSARPRGGARGLVALAGLFTTLTGLAGALAVGLVLLAAFQLPVIHRLYDTPLPWLVGLVWLLAPRAWLVVMALVTLQRREPNFLASLLLRSAAPQPRLAGQKLLWRNQWLPRLWAVALVCHWAYLDGTIAATLAPAAWISSPVRLYNLMHYGQSSVLSAMVVVTFGVPLAGIVLLVCARQLWVRR